MIGRAQVFIPGEYAISRYDDEQLLLPPLDAIAIKRYRYELDTIWDFSDTDTTSNESLLISDNIESRVAIGANLSVCYDNGKFIEYWHQSDSGVFARGTLGFYSETSGCDEESRFEYFGILNGNSETMPDVDSKLYDYDQFTYDFVSSFPGQQQNRIHSTYRGVKVVDAKIHGILITPFDTIEDCYMIRESGFVQNVDDEDDKYDLIKFYWFADSVGYPLLTRFQWLRPLRDTIGTFVKETTNLLRYQKPDPIIDVSPYTDCLIYPNPVERCFYHQFQEGDVEVVNLNGQPIRFDLDGQEICLSDNSFGLFVVVGMCNGRMVAKPVYRPNL